MKLTAFVDYPPIVKQKAFGVTVCEFAILRRVIMHEPGLVLHETLTMSCHFLRLEKKHNRM